MESRNYFLYKHYTSEGNLFYIGIGQQYKETTHYKIYKRAYDVSNRNFLWKRFYQKYGRVVEIVKDNLTEKECKELEVKLISKYGKIIDNSGILCNISNGGEGRFGDSSNSKRIYVYTIDGEFIREFKAVKEASAFYSLPSQNISKVANGFRRSCGGLQFSYSKLQSLPSVHKKIDYTPKHITLKKGEDIITFNSIYSAAKMLGLNKRHLFECIHGRRKAVKGWRIDTYSI